MRLLRGEPTWLYGIYIAASLAWLWLKEAQQPTATDMLGAKQCHHWALVIVGLAARLDRVHTCLPTPRLRERYVAATLRCRLPLPKPWRLK